MLNRHRIWALVAALSLAAPACAGGSDTLPGTGGGQGGATTTTTTTTAGGSGGGTAGSGGGTGGTMPMNGCKPSNDTVLAVDRLFFGDSDWNDIMDANAWTLFGLDVDGVDSMGTATGVCQPSAGASVTAVHTDGPNGLDNAFGKNLLPVFVQSIPSLTFQANAAIVNGDFTILFRLGGLGAGPDQGSIPGKVYSGAFLPSVPEFNGKDCWPVAPESLTDPADIESAKLSFPASAMSNHQWDSVSTGDLNLTLQVFSFQGHLTIHHARVVMDLDPDHQGTQRGTISGVLDTEEFVAAIDNLMAQFDPANCGASQLVTTTNQQIRRASDIMKDGTQDPTKTCDGITIGLGFKAAKVQFGTLGDALEPPLDPCTP